MPIKVGTKLKSYPHINFPLGPQVPYDWDFLAASLICINWNKRERILERDDEGDGPNS